MKTAYIAKQRQISFILLSIPSMLTSGTRNALL